MTDFIPFPKIARFNRDVVVTEKIDGTNATVHIDGDRVLVGSRSRWITPEDDHYGFAAYVSTNLDTFMQLGDGTHRGEWWGQGVERKYGLDHKRFSLFNTHRWTPESVPDGLFVVPVLAVLPRPDSVLIDGVLDFLRESGSVAAPGFMRPEGIVLWHGAVGEYFKITLEKDEKPKGSHEPEVVLA